MIKSLVLIVLLVVPGLAIFAICAHFALLDYQHLCKAYQHFQAVVSAKSDAATVFAAYGAQDAHRINVFADGVWALLGLVIAAIGLHGVCGGKRNVILRNEGSTH